jgi:hypothetical protein
MSIQITQWLAMEQTETELGDQLDQTRRILAGINRRNAAAVRRNRARAAAKTR